MTKNSRNLTSVLAAGALLAAPAAALASNGKGHTKTKTKPAVSCTNAHSVGISATGTLVSLTADDPATPANEATVTLTLTHANHNLRASGDIADQDAVKKGVQVKGATFTVPATDAYVLKLRKYEGTDTPSVGDRVSLHGRIAVMSKRCVPATTSIADRFGAIDVRRVTVKDSDPDA